MRFKHLGWGISLAALISLVAGRIGAETASGADPRPPARPALVAELRGLLQRLQAASSSVFFANHCAAILSVLDATPHLTAGDSLLLQGLYRTFSDTTVPSNASRFESYLERKRPFILTWISPTDGALSLAWLIPPENWNPDLAYPLTVRLHGLSDVYGTRIQYLCRRFDPLSVSEESFEGGYTLLPWGRGNLWYQGIGGTDVWESIDACEAVVRVDPSRKYLVGMSMGGYGAWRLGQESPETWAAVGVFAGALWYDGGALMTEEAVQKLKNVPVYIVCGTSDGLLYYNERAYELLEQAGNPDIAFATFDGGHVAPLAQWQDMYAWIRNFTNDTAGAEDEARPIHPLDAGLVGNYPNPFNPDTRIRYWVRFYSTVEMAVYDCAGRRVRRLLESTEGRGEHDIRWDGSDDSGRPVPGGVYVCRMRLENGFGIQWSSWKMCLMR
jgi:hypothetical protein